MTYDTVVIGAGLAGLSSAVRLSRGGRRVLVVAAGVGAIQLGGATVDVLGYAPESVSRPVDALDRFVASHPEHPYARLTTAGIRAGLEWFQRAAEPLGYTGSLDENLLLPTAVGTPKPSALVPRSMAGGDLRAGGSFTIVGLPALKDFYPSYLAANLARAGGAIEANLSARALESGVPVHDADVTPLGFARLFDDAEFRKAVIADLQGRLEPGEAVGFPAVLGLEDPETVWRELGDGLSSRVFEIPTLPPSVPGIRLFRTLKGALRKAGGRLLLGTTVTGADVDGHRARAVAAHGAARPMTLAADDFVLASGGFASGGLEMDPSWTVREPIFGLPVSGVPAPGGQRFDPDLLAHHPIARAGIAVDERLRPVDGAGDVILENVFVAGAMLAGAEPWREKSGDGISLSTGYEVAETILERGR
ncbi:glycerol-3-phosphate dehydrogenase subunit GlpB [soil metagenome]